MDARLVLQDQADVAQTCKFAIELSNAIAFIDEQNR
jgi:hypothetical protein